MFRENEPAVNLIDQYRIQANISEKMFLFFWFPNSVWEPLLGCSASSNRARQIHFGFGVFGCKNTQVINDRYYYGGILQWNLMSLIG
jgi:hypothetical protein